MQVIIVVLGLGELQSGAPNSIADVKQLFNHFPGLLGRLKTYVCIHYCVLSVLPFTLFSWHNVPLSEWRSPVIWTVSGFLCWSLATIQPQTHKWTSFMSNSVLWEPLWLPRAHCSSFACGFLRLGFGYCRFTTASPLLHTLCLCFPVPPVSTRAIVKKKKKKTKKRSFYCRPEAFLFISLQVGQ